MKFQLLPMLRMPEPSAQPVAALYLSLVAVASLAAATAVLLRVIYG